MTTTENGAEMRKLNSAQFANAAEFDAAVAARVATLCDCGHAKDEHTIDGCTGVDPTPTDYFDCPCHKFYGGQATLEDQLAATNGQQAETDEAINRLFTSMGKPIPFPSGYVR